MSRLSDDEKRVFTDRIAELQAKIDEFADDWKYNFEQYQVQVDKLKEENTLLAEHNQALMEKGAHLSHGCGLDGCLFAKYAEQLTGGDDANTD